jgi:hypothetical protein
MEAALTKILNVLQILSVEHQATQALHFAQTAMCTKNIQPTPATMQELPARIAPLQMRTGSLRAAAPIRHAKTALVLTKILSATQIMIADPMVILVQTSA